MCYSCNSEKSNHPLHKASIEDWNNLTIEVLREKCDSKIFFCKNQPSLITTDRKILRNLGDQISLRLLSRNKLVKYINDSLSLINLDQKNIVLLEKHGIGSPLYIIPLENKKYHEFKISDSKVSYAKRNYNSTDELERIFFYKDGKNVCELIEECMITRLSILTHLKQNNGNLEFEISRIELL
jgi:hypothetical protein